MLRYKKLDPNAPDLVAPEKGNAGYDLRANGNYTLSPYEYTEISTGIAIEIPPGHVGLVRGRSGLAFKNKVFSFDGTIDETYRGEWKMLVRMDGHSDFYTVSWGDKIAQVVIVPYLYDEVELVDELTDTNRGEKGFGSSGK